MDGRALLRYQLGATHQILVRSLADISDDESRRMPVAALSPVIWHLGHLVVTDAHIARKAGGMAAAAPADYAPLFKTGTGGKADYPPLGEIASAFDTRTPRWAALWRKPSSTLRTRDQSGCGRTSRA